MANGTCNECGKPARSKSADLCPMHYHRQYRHGDVTRTAWGSGISVSKGRRYKALYLPNHPLAMANGKVYTHRAVLYDKIGPEPATCHWCGRVVRWDVPRADPAYLMPDHLNGIGDDNDPANLVPSCNPCNGGRGVQARAAALREAGWWSGNDTVGRLGTRKPPVEPDVP